MLKKLILPVLFLFLAANAFAKGVVKSEFADFDGTKIHYYDTGRGTKALVFIHGWACSADFWSRSVKEFPGRRVIAVDLVGHGKSDKPKTIYTMDLFAKSVAAALKKAKVKKAVLVGHSMGTAVARQFYRLYPEKTLGIVIVDGSLRWDMTGEQKEEFYKPLRTNYQENSKRFVEDMLRPIKDEQIKAEIRQTMLATPQYVGLSAMEAFNEQGLWERDQIKVPVLAIMAKSDWWAADTESFYRTIAPDIDFQMWDGVSHFLMMEKPAEFNREIHDFIDEKKLL